MMTSRPSKKTLAALRECPEFTEVPLGGTPYPFLISVHGFEMATAAGHDPMVELAGIVSSLFGKGESPDLEDEQALTGAATKAASRLTSKDLGRFVTLVWAGILPFQPDLERDFVSMTFTPSTAMAVVRGVLPKALAFIRSQPKEVSADTSTDTGDDSGKEPAD